MVIPVTDHTADADIGYPLSHGQRALWFLQKLDPSSTAYNVVRAVRIRTRLNAEVFRQAVQAAVARHPALRTTFADMGTGPVQHIHDQLDAFFQVEEMTDGSSAQLDQRLSEETYRPFDLERGPLLRIFLFRQSDDNFVLLLVAHHIICDLWSMVLLMSEVPLLYQAALSGAPSPLRPLRTSYNDFVRTQTELLAGPEGDTLWAYWRERLANASQVLNLPTDRPRPPVITDRAAAVSHPFPVDLTEKLHQLAEAHNTNLYTLVLTALHVLLHRYSGQTDIVIGSPRAGRSARMAGLMGFFVNTIAHRAQLAGDPTFAELLTRANTDIAADLAHGTFPFSQLVSQLKPERDLSYSPLFQVMMAWQKTTRLISADSLVSLFVGNTAEQFEINGLVFEAIPFQPRVSVFDLVLHVVESSQTMSLVLEYNTALFDESTAVRLLGHVEVLLAGIVANPDTHISQLPLLTEAEQAMLRVNSQSPQAMPLPAQAAPQQVEAQAARTPNAPALRFSDAVLTYAEFNARANALAHKLTQLGVSANSLVGVCLERSLEMPIAILAILKAGGACVPLDPAYPRERLAFMLNDAQVAVLITHSSLLVNLPKTSAHILCLDDDVTPNSPPLISNLQSPISLDDLAYVLYTSGSTGQPKGVAMPHRSLANLIAWQKLDTPHSQPRTLQFSAFGFDVCLQEMFSTWSAGGELVMVADEVRRDSTALLRFLASERIERLFLPFVALQNLAEAAEPGAPLPTSLVDVCTAGEQLVITSAVARFFQRLPGCTLHNHYGPTESHVVTAHTLAGPPDAWPMYPPIGNPIPNTVVAILDAHRQPVPTGVIGELYLGGACLARGYINQPELTAEKFIEMNDQRLYRTGDRARWLADGTIEFLGRLDNQVKIRGFRVELGEVEAVLRQHPTISDAVVMVRDVKSSGHHHKQLVAYVVDHRAPVDIQTLRSYMQSKLPDYMLPSVIVPLSEMPLTASGKLDRNALPEPEQGLDGSARVLPRTPVQEMLANIYRDVLRIDRVALNRSFFDLGGDSLLATQVIARIREVFRVELPLRLSFEARTVEALAGHIEQALRLAVPVAMPNITPVGRDRPLPLSFSQERMWFIHQLDPNGSAYNVVTVMRMKGLLSVAAVQHSIDELAKRHESLRTTFPAIQGQPMQVIAPTISLPLTQIDLRHLPEAEREPKLQQLMNEEAARPFDIEHGPLFRVTLFRIGDEEWAQLSSVHHIITDAWSSMVLDQDSNALYNAYVRGEALTLPPLPVQYADYAVWQRQWLRGEVLDAQLAYWRTQLAGAPPLDLTTDHPRPSVQTYRGSFESVELDAPLLRELRNLATSEGATTFMVGLAAFYVLLQRYTAQTDISVGVPIANRQLFQSEQLIGSLVNTLVLRADLSGNLTFRGLLQRVRDISLDAYTHQSLPFAKLVAELNPTRDTAVSPLVQVMFNMINVPAPEMELDGLETEIVEVDRLASQFDLTFTIVDVPKFHSVSLEYNLDLFERETMVQMLAHYHTLLRLVIAQPDQPIDTLPLLNPAQRSRLLEEWNATHAEYDREQTLPAAFAEQVARTPYAVALRSGASTWTYAELNHKANQLARHLVQLGAQPGTLVGICMARSAHAIAGILATLKAGCAYVPLDPAYPAERIEYMIRDAQMPILLADNQTLATASQHSAQVINLDADWDVIAQHSGDDLNLACNASDTAYVIYTSGSTGKPKGVMGTHRGALNRAHWMWRVYPFEPGEVLCQKTSFNFIDAVWEIFGPLLHGVPSVILPDATVKDPDALVSAMAQHGVTRITLVPSLLKVLLETHPQLDKELPALQICVSSGEALAIDLAKHFVQRMPRTRLLNLYGSSEASGDSTFYEVTAQAAHAFIPIGKPMDNVQTYVLDAQRQPVPMGVPGELFISGDGLARGYLHQPEMTAERFVANPFSPEPGAWLYKTGDRVRYLPDGNLQYLGRNDDQIKIRGMRVTTGEIESVLKQHAALAEAVVMARPDRSGNLQLVAYVVALPNTSVAPGELRAYAESQLPGHMVPRGFVMLSALPLTPNGKLDKRALPNYEDAVRYGDIVAPRDEVERKLIPIWQRVLERPQVSVTDDFFELGGHSLLAVQLFAHIENDFAIKLPLSTLFQSPTPEGLARVLRRGAALQHASPRLSPLVPIQPNGSKPPFFCVHPIGGGVFGYAALARYLGEDQPVYGLEARPEEAHDPMRTQMEAMAAHYIEAMRTIQLQGPYYLGGYSFGATLSFEIARQLTAQGQKIGLLAMFDQAAPKSNYYAMPRLSLTVIKRFARNLSHWLKDFNQLPIRERVGRVRRKLLVRKPASNGGPIDLNRYMDDISLVPQEIHELMRAHLVAWEAYQPQPYPGRVTVLFTQRQPLICSYDPHMAWDSLAKGGVEMLPVAGRHRNLLAEPDVQSLAAALNQALARAQAHAG